MNKRKMSLRIQERETAFACQDEAFSKTCQVSEVNEQLFVTAFGLHVFTKLKTYFIERLFERITHA